MLLVTLVLLLLWLWLWLLVLVLLLLVLLLLVLLLLLLLLLIMQQQVDLAVVAHRASSRVQLGRLCGREQAHELAARDLRQQVVLRVVVQRGHRAHRPPPAACVCMCE